MHHHSLASTGILERLQPGINGRPAAYPSHLHSHSHSHHHFGRLSLATRPIIITGYVPTKLKVVSDS